VRALDAALGVVAPQTHVVLAAPAVRAAVGAAHGRDHPVALLQTGQAVADLRHLSQRLVAENQVVIPFGRASAVRRLNDLRVGAVNPYVAHTDQHLARADCRAFDLNHLDLALLLRVGHDGFHLWHPIPSPPSRPGLQLQLTAPRRFDDASGHTRRNRFDGQ
jgi:hypothetical protein